MSRNESKLEVKSKPPGKCPKCTFEGTNSNPKKFDQETMYKFPKGFAAENYVKNKVIKIRGQETSVIVTKDGKPQFTQINRCPVCGHRELSK